MTDTPPASLLITPDLRRRLQQQYEQAQRLTTSSSADFRRIHGLLGECLRADPGSVLYLDALLANLRRRDVSGSRARFWLWLEPLFKRFQIGKPAPLTQYDLLRAAPDALWKNSSDLSVLNQLANAAAACDLDQAELRYRQLTLEAAPHNTDSTRNFAHTLTRQGRFEEAVYYWNHVILEAPDDSTALQALTDLGSESHHFDETEQALVAAQAAGAPLLDKLQQREELQLARSEHRLTIARLRAVSDPHPKSQSLVAQLDAEHRRLEIEMCHLRCERLPQDWKLRLELGRLLKQARNFSGAIQRLEEGAQLRCNEPALLIELGECWQHLRQFTKALDYYQRAIVSAGEDQDRRELAERRAATLAAAMGRSSSERLDNPGAN